MDFFFQPGVAPFAAALVGVAAIGVVEVIGVLLAGVAGLSHLVNSAFDTADLPEGAVPEWLLVKGMPLMVTIVTALGGFGVAGLAAQAIATSAASGPMNLLAGLCVGAVGALASIRAMSALFSRAKLGMDTSAVSLDSLTGRKATLISPVARIGYAGEARVKDEHGHTHYVMVAPDSADFELAASQEFELGERVGTTFVARRLK